MLPGSARCTSAPATMSRMRQRLQLYSVLPRVRSNSLSTLTVTQPTSTSRPVLPTPPRLPSEAPKQSQHSQLALTQPTPGLHPPLFPANPPLSPNFNPAPPQSTSSFTPATTEVPRAHKRQRLQYQLDVGAYGIPKNRPTPRSFHTSAPSSSNAYPHTSLSVQVGEDAYFVRDNAMGIADGVGGWSKCASHSSHQPTPSALFSRRLMHFCSAELEAIESRSDSLPNSSPRPPTTQFSFQHHLKPRPPPPPNHYEVFAFSELEDSLHASLEELSEGIDVLNILERAYDSTVKSHVVPSSPTPTPLTTGSSTALLAILDHPPASSGPLPQSPEAPHKNYAAGSLYQPDILTEPTTSSQPHVDSSTSQIEGEATTEPYDAVIRIAHLGDCMGMLVHGDKIAWRSDEMWWGYNHPLQLGPPANSSNPTAPIPLPVKPHTFTLPVRADDILILASDGLSDNLWDEDVLDEVLKFRQNDSWGFSDSQNPDSHQTQILRRKAFAGMLSEALCSRAKRVSETRPASSAQRRRPASPRFSVITEENEGQDVTADPASSSSSSPTISLVTSEEQVDQAEDEIEIPFARRAKLAGKTFRGGKHDDISVIVAVISPSPSPLPSKTTTSPSSTSKASNGQAASATGIDAHL